MSGEMPMVYPVSETVPPSNTSSANGSYGAVFIVLAVIIIVSAFACFLGRLFNKRHNSAAAKPSEPKHQKDAKPSNNNGFQTKDGDIEFGYDKRLASAKVAATGESTMHQPRPNSFHEPAMGRPDSFREPAMGGPESFNQPAMRRPDNLFEPTMERPNSFDKGDHQVRFDVDGDNKLNLNFKPRARPQRY